ncbi:DUF3180 domain-containing protein [Pseudonocardia sp. GCM10023141]|uniref:DUF3180 domain-containing protein n=1 Tax=Pseudonocardia sp. GCM10023141 TaxID=3252653 RepID=UPI003620D146
MKPTRPRDLLVAGLITMLVVNVVIRMTYGSLPGFPLLAGATLGVLAVAEAIAGSALRVRIRGDEGSRPVEPLVAARAVVVAKASAVAGAVVAGAWAGLLVHVVPRSGSVTAAASDAGSGIVGLVCALGLVAGALWLEHCLRSPDNDRNPRNG